MNKKEKFEKFLESLKGKGQDVLIESVKKGFQACMENEQEYRDAYEIKYQKELTQHPEYRPEGYDTLYQMEYMVKEVMNQNLLKSINPNFKLGDSHPDEIDLLIHDAKVKLKDPDTLKDIQLRKGQDEIAQKKANQEKINQEDYFAKKREENKAWRDKHIKK